MGIQKAKSDALEILKSGKTRAVLTISIGSDAKAIKRATEELKRVAPGLAFICLTADEEKITAFSYVPDNLTDNLKANEWVAKSLEACNGRGGGKPNSAQGSATTGSVEAKEIALSTATVAANKFL